VTAWARTVLAQRTEQKVRVLQETLHRAAKADPKRMFGVLYDKVTWWEVLWLAWYRVRRNRGAPGVDGRTIEAIKASGEVRFLREIQAELRAKAYRPRPVRRVFIPKGRGQFRALGIPVVKEGSGHPGGGEDRARADLRSEFSGRVIWVSARAWESGRDRRGPEVGHVWLYARDRRRHRGVPAVVDKRPLSAIFFLESMKEYQFRRLIDRFKSKDADVFASHPGRLPHHSEV